MTTTRHMRWLFPLAVFALALAAGSIPARAQCGTRWITQTGNDAANNCLSSASPCRTINHGIGLACANDAVEVGEGTWTEDVLIDRAVYVNSTGNNANTILRGAGGDDIVRILASGAQLNGFAVTGPNPGRACVRIGDAAHPGVRTTQLTNLNVSGCTVGVVVDSVGAAGDWIRITGNIVANHAADGSANGGVGVLLTGGAGRVDIRQNNFSGNGGPAVKLATGGNGTLQLAGNTFTGNALAILASGRAAVEIHAATDLRMEGNLFTGQTGLGAVDDGRGAWIDGANGVEFFCNEMRGNDGGLAVSGTVTGLAALQNRFFEQTGPAIEIAAGSAPGVRINETIVYANGQGLVNGDTAPVDARHNWWGAASGPGGPGGVGGSGDTVTGPADVGNFITRTLQPVLAKAPKTGGWSRATGACYDTLQPALDAAPTGSLILIGEGEIRGQATMTRAVDLEGIPGEIPLPYCDRCYRAVIDGTQLGGPRRPALTLSGVSGVTLRYLTIHGAGMGTPACFGGHQDSEVGLDLVDVKNSLFQFLDLRENGTTEIRVRGDSDDNTFDGIYLDGMIRDGDNEDRCGHRSREGFLIDGGPRACEGGAGATADRNRILNSSTYHITRSIKLRWADATEIAASVVHGVPSDEWPEPDAQNIWIEASSDTWIHDNREIGNRGVSRAIAILGSRSCEAADSARTRVEHSTIDMIDNSGTGLYLVHEAGDNGAPVDTRVSCSTIRGAWKGVVADWVGGAQIERTDLVSDTSGIINNTADTLLARRNWWGSPSGPSGAGPGTGTSVTAGVDYADFLASSALDDADGDGVSECQGDADDGDPLVHPVDGCDAFDNDLDGTLDEDFLPAATQCGTGVCAATGTTVCVGGLVQDSCQPLAPPSPTDATCDAIDEDCDGTADDDYPATPTTCGVGVCARSGAVSCVGGVVQDTCAPGDPVAPTDATCNALDDDCDGQSDEEFAAGPTSCGLGACASTGVSSCVGGVAGDSCVPGPPLAPSDTTCDGVDDNCDGLVDDGYLSLVTACGLGVCERVGSTSCVGGAVQDSCVPGPPAAPDDASCNGQDDDCSGQVDEDYAAQPTVCGVGACAALGSIACEAGQPVEICTPGEPSPEVCNYLDDDCDGVGDNNIPIPDGPLQLGAERSPSSGSAILSWPSVPAALTYDVLRGRLPLLVASGGDFSVATDLCLIDNVELTSWAAPDVPAPGDGYWYLVRAANCAGVSSYDAGESEQSGLAAPRDPGIAASPQACP
jgi:hypothetical protein